MFIKIVFILENSNQPNYWTQLQLKNIQKQVKVCNVHLREMKFIAICTAESNIFPQTLYSCTEKYYS